MKRTILISALLTLLLGTFYVACQYHLSEKVIIAKPAFDSVLVKRGEYLVLTNVCDACHSPKSVPYFFNFISESTSASISLQEL